MNKKTFYLTLLSINIILILFLIISAIGAFLTYKDIKDNQNEIGVVDVDMEIYFEILNEDDEPVKYEGNIDYSVTVGEDLFTKFNVVKVNISTVDDPQFITNLRVKINVKSSVDTYLRVAPYEQLTYTYTIGGITREVASTQTSFMKFNYDPNNQFFNNRLLDGFYYYKEKVKRESSTEPTVIEFIGEYGDTSDLRLYDPKYSLQIGFLIEAVQALNGPQNTWGLDEPPWESENGW